MGHKEHNQGIKIPQTWIKATQGMGFQLEQMILKTCL